MDERYLREIEKSLENKELAAARAEIERLTKERDYKQTVIEKLSDHIEKAEAERDEATSTLELVNSNNLTLAAELAGWKQAARQMEAERDEARAQVAAAFEAAAQEVGWWAGPRDIRMKTIRALTPADAQFALEAYGREKMREGMQKAADLFKDANHGEHIISAILAAMKGGDDE